MAILPGDLARSSRRAELDAKVPLTRRGHFRIEPLQVRGPAIRSGSFEASATVGQAVTPIVYSRVEPLPRWRLPAASVGCPICAPARLPRHSRWSPRSDPYAPGDAMNRIHWPSTARQGGRSRSRSSSWSRPPTCGWSLDLDRDCQVGRGDDSTVEVAVRAAASIAERALAENRAVGITVNARQLGPGASPTAAPASGSRSCSSRGRERRRSRPARAGAGGQCPHGSATA